MADRVLLDTGPLVAVLAPNDQYHEAAVAGLARLPRNQPLITCWPVITEAAWLLRNVPGGLEKLLQAVDGWRVDVAPMGIESCSRLAEIATSYSSLLPQLADVALLYLAERDKIDVIFTFDRRHFSVYRMSNSKSLELFPKP